MSKPKRHAVKEIQRLVLAVLKSNPPHLLVSAHGIVASTGWGDPALVPRGEPGADGRLVLDFTVAPLPVTLAQIDLPVHAAFLYEGELGGVTSVCVHAERNQLVEAVAAARRLEATGAALDALGAEGAGGQRAVSVKALPQTVRELIGHRLRVIRQGEQVGGDYDPERVNLYLDQAQVIANITFG
jgi:hypothetical protein